MAEGRKYLLQQIKKIKTLFILIGRFFKNMLGMFRSIHFLIFFDPLKMRIMFGYWHYTLAKRLANKRHSTWKNQEDQLGKTQGILPFSEDKLIVCSLMELKIFQSRGLLDPHLNCKKMFKSAYYKTKSK